MKIKKYLKDKLYLIVILLLSLILITLNFLAFKINKSLILVTNFILIISYISIFLIDIFKKKKFYTTLLENINNLDKAYLVQETIEKPNFYEGELTYQALYEINKSYLESINSLNEQQKDFKEYVEMWIHEVKIPLSSLVLIQSNHKDKYSKSMKIQLKRLEEYVEQVLYYVRSENASKDYLIKEVSLANIIKNIGLKNMDDLLENKIDFIVENINNKVLTDSKWLEFIIGGIVNNSIKYKRNIPNSYIKITTTISQDRTILIIEDNGIGIKDTDIKQVFDKSFTGENGRIRSKSTGMGLFIAKNMCEKLGHKISIESKYQEYTKVYITFSKNNFYDPIK